MRFFIFACLALATTVAKAEDKTTKEKRKPSASSGPWATQGSEAEGMPFKEGYTGTLSYGKFVDGDVTCYYVGRQSGNADIQCFKGQ